MSLLGRLVVDKKFQGKGLGKILLIDALKRSFKASLQMSSFAVAVDPIDSEARVFYEQYGFITLPDSGKMFITMKTLKELFK
ncbi:GNAT family N-acetyltransferase [Aquirufa sp. BABACH-43C]|nr:GNAT family N-acetyltransferase [Aquirufa ecclesiirivi]MDF0692881.1 GNAT family N-acetyltransferase [Aquirufa ecclesiirivi]